MKHFHRRQKHLAGLGSLAAGLVLALFAPGGTGTAAAQALVQNRIVAPIRAGAMQALPGTVHPLTAVASDAGALSGSTEIHGMSLVFKLSAAQEADLNQLLKEQQTPGSPMYHQWLKSGQFAARYGVSQSDLAKAAAWLRQQGFTIDSIPPSANRIVFSGTAAQVNAAFQTQMHRYTLRGQSYWANATQISVPQAIAGMTLRIAHLNTFRPRPQMIKRYVHAAQHGISASAKPQYTLCNSNASPCPSGDVVNLIAPSDSQTIYDVTSLYNNNITGTGQTLAIMGQTDIETYKADIQHFRSLSGLNASNMPTQIVVSNSGTAAVSVADLQEADLDVEWSGAIAENANIVYVTVGNNPNYGVFDSLQYAIQNPLVNNDTQYVPVISISYGGCEQQDISVSGMNEIDALLKRANTQGQTVIAASGDDGSAQCDDSDSSSSPVAASHGLAVNYPASSAYATAAGGTSFSGDLTDQSKYWSQSNNADNGSALSYIPETTWNDTPTLADLTNPNLGNGQLSASGGGASAVFSKPSWQTGAGVPSDGKRDVPDISLAADPAHDAYVVCTEETNSAGTSLSGVSTCNYPVSAGQLPYIDANGYIYFFGGTSIATPQLAAMITLWNQKAGNTAGSGNINPILYAAAQTTPGAFHDVTTGSNAVVCKQGSPDCISNGSGGYVMSCCNAGAGYDEATGLGSVDAAAIAAIWPSNASVNPSFSLAANPTTLSVAAGNSGTTTVAINPSGGFTGAVSLKCSGLPADTTCSFSPASANITSGAQNITVTFATTSSASRENPRAPFDRNWPMQTAFAGVFGLALLGVGRKKRRIFPRGWIAALLLVAGLMAATALTACGGGSSPSGSSTTGGGSTPPTPTSTTTTVKVTGTSASTTSSVNIALTITSS